MCTRASDLLIFRLRTEPGFVDGREFSDRELAELPADTCCLSLEQSRVSDAGLRALPVLPRLRCLDLDGTSITDRALEWVAEQPALEELWLEQTVVSDVGLSSLQGLRSLRSISLLDTEVTVEGVNALRATHPTIEVHW
jgi:hypothetical protein